MLDTIKVVYYYDADQGVCPEQEYLSQFSADRVESQSTVARKLKLLADIDAKIRKVAENGARALPPIATPLREYGCIEIKHRKNRNILIRIIFFRWGGLMVLLHAFEKPDNYHTNRLRREVDKQFILAQRYKEKFIFNQSRYEEYN